MVSSGGNTAKEYASAATLQPDELIGFVDTLPFEPAYAIVETVDSVTVLTRDGVDVRRAVRDTRLAEVRLFGLDGEIRWRTVALNAGVPCTVATLVICGSEVGSEGSGWQHLNLTRDDSEESVLCLWPRYGADPEKGHAPESYLPIVGPYPSVPPNKAGGLRVRTYRTEQMHRFCGFEPLAADSQGEG